MPCLSHPLLVSAAAFLGLRLYHSYLCLHLHITFSSVCLIFLCFSHETLVVTFRAHPDNPRLLPHLKILKLITSAQTLPYKITFKGSRDSSLISLVYVLPKRAPSLISLGTSVCICPGEMSAQTLLHFFDWAGCFLIVEL